MFENASNSKKKGDIGMAFAIAYFSKLGYTVSIPITDSQDYDLLIDNKKLLQKVQVKTTSHKSKHGLFQVALRTMGGNQSFYTSKNLQRDNLDLLFCMTEEGKCYLIPIVELKNETTLSLGKKVEKFEVKLFG